MKTKIALLLAAGGAVFAAHASYLIWRGERIAQQWAQVDGESALTHYISQRDYLLSLSYAIAAAFTLYAWLRARANAKSGAPGVVGGFTLAGLLSLGGCWFVGCCGSPLLPVYLSLFGSSFVGFTKPLVLALTLSSVSFSLWWMNRKSRHSDCGCNDPQCETDMKNEKPVQEIRAELAEGMNLPKCQQCGCMKETLEQLGGVLPSLKTATAGALASEVGKWQRQMKPIKYACLGCAHCYPAVAMNVLHKEFPDTEKTASLSCEFEVRPNTWPAVPGEYFEFCEGDTCPVAVSTLASAELADTLAQRRPRELCIVGKTETENIGIDKLVKNTITNRSIRYLVVAGRDPKGHDSGNTLLALASNGVDDSMRVIGSSGKRPILRNVTRDEVETFRHQVEVVDMIGCDDAEKVINRMRELTAKTPSSCGFSSEDEAVVAPATISDVPTVQAQPPARVEMDKAGYFVIIPRAEKGDIAVEHYSYDNKMLRTIEGRDARGIYWTIIQNGWVSQLSHAAYLGKELTRAELSLKHGFKFVQDGA
jgi:tetrahydromethanopterin S-methyltransferase subunit A